MSSDLQAKYQRLASEYSKLKAQLPVLKKAVVDEQTVQEKLKISIKEKDQCVRKYEQEVDSLNFRNQQLAKRVLFLQEELDQVSIKKKSKGKSGSSIADAGSPTSENPVAHSLERSVIGEELQSKIEENARLHKQVFESQQEYDTQLRELQDRVCKYEKESNQHNEVLNLTLQKGKSEVDRLQQEKAMMEIKLQKQQNQIKEYKSQTERMEEHLHDVQEHLTEKLKSAAKIIENNLPFIDSGVPEFNSLNVPTHDRRYQLRARELMSQAVGLTSAFTIAFSNFCTYSEQRARHMCSVDHSQDPLTIINTRYAKHLFENASYFKGVEETMKTFNEELGENCFTTLETATGLQLLAAKFHQLVTYLNKLLPYQLESLHQESALSTCTTMLEAKNIDLCKSFKRLNSVFNRLETYVSMLGAQSHKSCPHSKKNHQRLFAELSFGITSLHEAVKDVSKHFNSKISMEHQLPTASQKLKTTDECIVSSLVSLVTCTGKLSAFFAGNEDFFGQRANYRSRGSSITNTSSVEDDRANPIVAQYRQKASDYLSRIQEPPSETVPYHIALENRTLLLNSTESKEGLSKQIQTFQEKISKLEQHKEHYMLELQLLKMKCENETQKVKQLEKTLEETKRVEGNSTNLVDVTSTATTTAEITSETESKSCVLSESRGESVLAADADTREQLIKDHLTNRINQLTLNLQLAESKAISFHAEVRSLHRRLAIAEQNKESAIEELKQASLTQAQLKDELTTTTRSYEGQLSMMSEHLASMNEKLTSQKDEIDELTMQISMVKGQKKSKK